ncbi:MFS transporter [Phyllobacterium salinisoli]|uniref:MFS transporter n=1 Tax=Phyllobacterium salinisoli TaxID=1899321 RepID=A0A368K8W2_9HYPH|nr:MFS transporter [Phyllobacterium salinisoli]RCS25796.1 MFS transporter [Phyllobacterium salinisoli]
MSASSIRTIIPLSILTAVGLLATDLYLPAVPSLPMELGGTVSQAQATLAVFLASLALSQIVWGVIADQYHERTILQVAIALQIVAGIACATAESVLVLIAARAVQGFAVGAATVVVPSLIRRHFRGKETVRAMSWLGIAESIIPAVGPIAGAALLLVADWRASFWAMVVLTSALAPFALRAVPPPADRKRNDSLVGYGELVRDRVYFGYALGHALCFAALLTFVASAPQVVQIWLSAGPQTFATLQAFGVTAFVLTASQSSRLTGSFGIDRLIATGVMLQIAASVAMMVLALADYKSPFMLIAAWVLFCAALGLRGPATMVRALDVAPEIVGRASGLLMFLALGLAAGGTQLVAPFLSGGLMPVALISLGYTFASGLLILMGCYFRAKDMDRRILYSAER